MSKKDEIRKRDLNYNYRIVGIMDKYKRAIGDEFGMSEHSFETVATEIERIFAKSNAEWFNKGQNSIKRKNKSGCCCILDDSDNILSACGAHQDWHDELIKPAKSGGNVRELQTLCNDINEWQDKQFPTATARSKVKHLGFEVGELLIAPYDYAEYADCFMLLIGAANSAGMTLETLISAVREKLEINKKRNWGKPNKDGFTEHIK